MDETKILKFILQFCGEIKHWPKNLEERDRAAELLGIATGSDFVAILADYELPGESGLRFTHLPLAASVNREGILQFLIGKIHAFNGGNHDRVELEEAHRIQLTSNDIIVPLSSHVQYLLFQPLVGSELRGGKPKSYAVFGSSHPFTSEDESIIHLLIERFHDLKKISDLEFQVQMRNQFLSIASHELKTPLTSIYGILQLQERMLRVSENKAVMPDKERYHNFLKMVIRQVERLNDLIDDLLDVSRIQNNRFIVEPSVTDVAEILKECLQSRLSVIAQEASVKIQVDSLSELKAVVDPVRMEEVISNLVMNAIRFSPEGGVVWVRLRSEEGAFRLTVRDQGPSILMGDRERIFQPFEKAQRTGRMGGLGLGLFISRQIAQLHGGNVSLVESVQGKGNVFEAHFPLGNIQS